MLLLCFIASNATSDEKASPLDALRADLIPIEERPPGIPKELVGMMLVHPRAISSVTFSRDGQLFASSSWDGTVRIWRFGKVLPEKWADLPASASGIAFTPDRKLLITGTEGTNTLAWDISGDRATVKYRIGGHKSRPFVTAIDPEGKLLVTGSADPTLRLWKLPKDEEPEAWGALANEDVKARGVTSLAFFADGKTLVAGALVGTPSLRLWDVTGSYLLELECPKARARLVACSPNGKTVAFTGDDSAISLWDFEDGKVTKKATLAGHPWKGVGPGITAFAFSPDGKRLLSAGKDKRFTLWNLETRQKDQDWGFGEEIRALTFAPDGRHIALGSDDGGLYILRLAR